MQRCSRCGGQILNNYGEQSCLQCGFDSTPSVISSSGLSLELLKAESSAVNFSIRSLSDKPSQIRRRKRRLIKAGYSEKEVNRIINLQVEK